ACSTVTVNKCQAALRTLQTFIFFRPTCLCKEPHVDPDCNSFQNFLFDHPCDYVEVKEKEPIDTLPTCNHALHVCQHGKACNQMFKDFKTNCKFQDGQCKMENRLASIDNSKLTPLESVNFRDPVVHSRANPKPRLTEATIRCVGAPALNNRGRLIFYLRELINLNVSIEFVLL
ncbi:hypothetical protein HN011_010396, partial [Eciton burchellii]